MYKVYAPNKGYAGIFAGVAFVNGEAETEDKRMIQWFKEKGYEVEEVKENEEDIVEDAEENNEEVVIEDENMQSFEDMTLEELKELAKEKEIKGYSKMKKEDLINALTE